MITVPEWVPAWSPLEIDAHKGTAGRVAVVGGSPGLSGAVCLATTAALRAGAGLVTALVPRSLSPIVESSRAETMTIALESDDGVATGASQDAIEFLQSADAIVIGPGFGRDARTIALQSRLFELPRPMVIDADGLHALASSGNARPADAPTVITPHPGELPRLLDATGHSNAADLARATGYVVVEKSSRTVVHGLSGSTPACEAGNPSLATGGSGDVLAGLIGALLARSGDAESSARLGVWIHARAADHAAYGERVAGSRPGPATDPRDRAGEPGTLPSDVCEHFLYAFRELTGRPSRPKT